MLSDREGKEFIQDGLNLKRREDFRKLKELQMGFHPSFETYAQFLTQVQKVFSALPEILPRYSSFNKNLRRDF